jgi:cellobiose-specific phosphotransferase system component IIB
MKDLSELLEKLGLTVKQAVLLSIVIFVIVWFLIRYLDQRKKRREKRDEVLDNYLRLQEEALLKTYRKLYEERDLTKMSKADFHNLIKEVDELVLAPFSQYRAHLDGNVQKQVYHIHNIINQFKGELSSDAITNLLSYRQQFYNDITLVKKAIEKNINKIKLV